MPWRRWAGWALAHLAFYPHPGADQFSRVVASTAGRGRLPQGARRSGRGTPPRRQRPLMGNMRFSIIRRGLTSTSTVGRAPVPSGSSNITTTCWHVARRSWYACAASSGDEASTSPREFVRRDGAATVGSHWLLLGDVGGVEGVDRLRSRASHASASAHRSDVQAQVPRLVACAATAERLSAMPRDHG